MEKVLGKIDRAEVGFGGYQEAMFGLTIGFSSGSMVCGDFLGSFPKETPEPGRWDQFGDKIIELLRDAKVDSVSKLVGKPVEICFDGLSLKTWRVLIEVL
jgi:hypothetical protein